MAAVVALVAFFLSFIGAGILDQDALAIVGLVFLTLATAAGIAIITIDPDSIFNPQPRSRT
jgi:hypothetical protein